MTKKDLEITIAALPEGIVLKTGEKLTRDRVREAIFRACGGKLRNFRCEEEFILGKGWHKKRDYTGSRYAIMLSRDHELIGVVLNDDVGPCRMEGCTGRRQYVRWEDGTYTFPCSKGCSSIAIGVEMIG